MISVIERTHLDIFSMAFRRYHHPIIKSTVYKHFVVAEVFRPISLRTPVAPDIIAEDDCFGVVLSSVELHQLWVKIKTPFSKRLHDFGFRSYTLAEFLQFRDPVRGPNARMIGHNLHQLKVRTHFVGYSYWQRTIF